MDCLQFRRTAGADPQHLDRLVAAGLADGVEQARLQVGTAGAPRGLHRTGIAGAGVRQFEQRMQQQIRTVQQTLGAVVHLYYYGLATAA